LKNGIVVSDLKNDVLKIVVVNRYSAAEPAVAFINGFGFKEGAIASSVAHDSHNIVAVGKTDKDIANAINLVVREKGGVGMDRVVVDLILKKATKYFEENYVELELD
jgi:adenine deaminase